MPKPIRPRSKMAKIQRRMARPFQAMKHMMVKHAHHRNRVRHAARVLEGSGLSGKALRECTLALAELPRMMDRKENLERIVRNFPRVVESRPGESPRLTAEYRKWRKKLEDETHFVNERRWKLILELEKVHPGKGQQRAIQLILAFEKSFEKPHA